MSNRIYTACLGTTAFASARTSPPRFGVRDVLARIAAFFAARAEARARSRRARNSVRQLMSLSNRALKDMGISRSEILSVVYGPAGERRLGAGRGD